jgi:glycerophosphoryl diester phosphodiesterase
MSKGIKTMETDVRFTKDEDPMIMHDPTVDATTNGTGNIANLTYAQVHALRTPKGNYVPTFYNYLTDLVKYGGNGFPELKTVPTDAEWTILEQKITSAKIDHSRLTFISFEKDAIAGAHARGYKTAWLDNTGDRLPSEIPPGAYLDKTQQSVTQPRTIAWHAAGIKVYAWTVNDVANWHRLGYTDKVDGITTDKPIAYAAWVKGGCKK